MKNVKTLTKLRRLTKSLAISIAFIFLGILGSSFTTMSFYTDPAKKPISDSSSNEKNSFPSLFGNSDLALKLSNTPVHPAAAGFVLRFVQQNADRLNRMKVWGKPYFDIYDGILHQHGLPEQLKYLSVIESALKPGALSPMGALGPWQIMPELARDMGLIVSRKVDDRKNYYKSTHAAARFLKSLFAQYSDWLLVIAAYNCGPGRVNQAIRKAGSKDFWTIQQYLPLETRNHVKKFIGTHYIFEGSGGLTTMTAAEIDQHNLVSTLTKANASFAEGGKQNLMSAEVKGKYNSHVLAAQIGMEVAAFNLLNPQFDKQLAKGSTYQMQLPVDKMLKFDNRKQKILEESVHILLN
jgi:membrane-bound lytic murein transglycosylase D